MDTQSLPTLGQAIRQAMLFDVDIYIAVRQSPRGIWLALAVVALAGISESVGQSLVLFINKVRPRRFIPAVLISLISYIAGYLLWTASVYIVGRYGFGKPVTWLPTAAVVGMAYAPQVLAFFELTPFFGNPFGILLTLWSMVAVVIAVQTALGLTLGQSVLAAGLGWLLLQLVRRTVGIPVYSLGRWLRRKAIGAQLQYAPKDLPQLRRRSAKLLNAPQETPGGREPREDPLA
jgi:hypothetical protein